MFGSKKGKATFDINKIAKNPNKGKRELSSSKAPTMDMEEMGYSSTIVSEAPNLRETAKAKKEASRVLTQETTPEEKVQVISEAKGKPVEEVVKEAETKKGGLSASFKSALAGLAPSAVGMLVGGLVGGSEGAVAGYREGNALGQQMNEKLRSDRNYMLQKDQLDQTRLNQERQAALEMQKQQAQQSKSTINLDLKAEGMGNAPVAYNPSTGKYTVGDKEIPAGSIKNLKIDNEINKKRLEALKASKSLDKEQLKATMDLQKQVTQDLKNIGLQDIATSMGRIQELYTGESEGKDYANNETYKTPSGKTIKASGSRDAALVINFMKLADPGSVVREGEFNMARGLDRNLAGVLNSWYNKGAKGLLLTEQQRSQLVEAARLQAIGAYENGKAISSRATDTANTFGIDPELVKDRSLQRLGQLVGADQPEASQGGLSLLKSKYMRGK